MFRMIFCVARDLDSILRKNASRCIRECIVTRIKIGRGAKSEEATDLRTLRLKFTLFGSFHFLYLTICGYKKLEV
jgi:hypothetical protein